MLVLQCILKKKESDNIWEFLIRALLITSYQTQKNKNKRLKIWLAWISLRASTRFLTMGVKFSRTSECCPAKFCNLFCTTHQNQESDTIIKTKSFCYKNSIFKSRTDLKSIDKACTILNVKGYISKTTPKKREGFFNKSWRRIKKNKRNQPVITYRRWDRTCSSYRCSSSSSSSGGG